jgi:hypothetical protein
MIYQHDIGTKIEFLVDEASYITEAKIIVKKPDSEVIEWVAQIDDKSIFYITNIAFRIFYTTNTLSKSNY